MSCRFYKQHTLLASCPSWHYFYNIWFMPQRVINMGSFHFFCFSKVGVPFISQPPNNVSKIWGQILGLYTQGFTVSDFGSALKSAWITFTYYRLWFWLLLFSLKLKVFEQQNSKNKINLCSPESEENGTKYCRLIYLRNTAVCIEPYSSYEKAIGTVF